MPQQSHTGSIEALWVLTCKSPIQRGCRTQTCESREVCGTASSLRFKAVWERQSVHKGLLAHQQRPELSDWTEPLARGRSPSFHRKHSLHACCRSAEDTETLKFSLGPWWLSALPRTLRRSALGVLLRPIRGPPCCVWPAASHVDGLNFLLSFLGVTQPLLSVPASGGQLQVPGYTEIS